MMEEATGAAFTIGYVFGLLTVFLMAILGGFRERGSNVGIVTEMSKDHVMIDGGFKIKAPPTKNLMIGDTVNFYTN